MSLLMQVQVPLHRACPQAPPLLLLAPLLQPPTLVSQAQAVWQHGHSVVARTTVQATVQMQHMMTSSAEVDCHAVDTTAPGGNADLLVRSSAQAAPPVKVAATVAPTATVVGTATVPAAAAAVMRVAAVMVPAAAALRMVDVEQQAVGHWHGVVNLATLLHLTAAQAVHQALVHTPVPVQAEECFDSLSYNSAMVVPNVPRCGLFASLHTPDASRYKVRSASRCRSFCVTSYYVQLAYSIALTSVHLTNACMQGNVFWSAALLCF